MHLCRICLRPTEKCHGLYSSQDGLQIGEIIKICVPEVDLAVSKYPVLCHPCMKLLNASYFFKKLCMHTENCIGEYIRKNSDVSNYVNLTAVVDALFGDSGMPPLVYKNLPGQSSVRDELASSNDDNVSAAVVDRDHEHFDFNLGQPVDDAVPASAGISVKIKSVEKINETVDGGSDKAIHNDGFAYQLGLPISLQDVPPPPLVMINETASDPLAIGGVGSFGLKISPDIVVLDDDDDDVQVIEPSRAVDPLGSLLRSAPAIENNDVPELVSITRVDPLNQNAKQPPRRQTVEVPRTTVPDKPIASGKDSEPKPIKVVNPKTNQVQIIGYVLSPGSKDRPIITNSRTNSRYSVQRVQTTQPEVVKPAPVVAAPVPETKPSVSAMPDIVVPPLTVVTRSAARAKNPRQYKSANTTPTTARENFFSGLKLKQANSPAIDPFEDEEQDDDAFAEDVEDDPDYVSLRDIQQMGGKEIEQVVVKEEAVDDEAADDSQQSQGAKRTRTDDSEESSREGPARRKPKKAKTQAGGPDHKLKLLPVVQLRQLTDPLNVAVKEEIKEEATEDTRPDSLESVVDTFRSATADHTSGHDTNSNAPVSKDAVQVPDLVELAGRDGEEAQDGSTLPAKRQRKPAQRQQNLDSADESSQESGAKQSKRRGRPRKNPPGPPPSEEGTVTKRRGRRKKLPPPDPTVMVTEIMKQAGLYHFLSGEDSTEQKKRGKKQNKEAAAAAQPAMGEGIGLFHSLFGNIADMHNESSDNAHLDSTYEQEQTDTSLYNSGNFENDSSMCEEASGECLEVDIEQDTVASMTETAAVSNENSNRSGEANPVEDSVEEMSDSTSNQHHPEPVRDSPVPSATGSSNDGLDQACDSMSSHQDQTDLVEDNTEAAETLNSMVSENEACDTSIKSTSNSNTSLHCDSDKAVKVTSVKNFIKESSDNNIEIVEEEEEVEGEDVPEFVDPAAC